MSGNYRRAERLTDSQEAVMRVLLLQGQARTPDLRRASGLPHEEFFAALAQLEARGRIRFVQGRRRGGYAYCARLRAWEVPR